MHNKATTFFFYVSKNLYRSARTLNFSCLISVIIFHRIVVTAPLRLNGSGGIYQPHQNKWFNSTGINRILHNLQLTTKYITVKVCVFYNKMLQLQRTCSQAQQQSNILACRSLLIPPAPDSL